MRRDSIHPSRWSRKVLPGRADSERGAPRELPGLERAINLVSCFSCSSAIMRLSSRMWLNGLKLSNGVPAEGLSLLNKPANSLHTEPPKQDEWPGRFETLPKLLPLPGWWGRLLLSWDNDGNGYGLMRVDCGSTIVLTMCIFSWKPHNSSRQ